MHGIGRLRPRHRVLPRQVAVRLARAARASREANRGHRKTKTKSRGAAAAAGPPRDRGLPLATGRLRDDRRPSPFIGFGARAPDLPASVEGPEDARAQQDERHLFWISDRRLVLHVAALRDLQRPQEHWRYRTILSVAVVCFRAAEHRFDFMRREGREIARVFESHGSPRAGILGGAPDRGRPLVRDRARIHPRVRRHALPLTAQRRARQQRARVIYTILGGFWVVSGRGGVVRKRRLLYFDGLRLGTRGVAARLRPDDRVRRVVHRPQGHGAGLLQERLH